MSKDIIKMLKNITNKIKKVINNKLEEIKKDYEKHQIDLLLRKSVKELNIPKIIEALEKGANPNNVVLSPEYDGDKIIVTKKADSLLDYAEKHFCIEQSELVVKLLKSAGAKRLVYFTYEDFMKIKDIKRINDSYKYIKHLIAKTYKDSYKKQEIERKKQEKMMKEIKKEMKIVETNLEKEKQLVEEYLKNK